MFYTKIMRFFVVFDVPMYVVYNFDDFGTVIFLAVFGCSGLMVLWVIELNFEFRKLLNYVYCWELYKAEMNEVLLFSLFY